MNYKVGDKIRFHRNWDRTWRYATIEEVRDYYDDKQVKELWGHWHDLNGPPEPELSYILSNARTLELVRKRCPMEVNHAQCH